MGFNPCRWVVVTPRPLSLKRPNTKGRLRAYGNALVPWVASAFIASVMDILIEEAEKHASN